MRMVADFSVLPSPFVGNLPTNRFFLTHGVGQIKRARLPPQDAKTNMEERRAATEAERRFFPSTTAFVIAHYADDVEYRLRILV